MKRQLLKIITILLILIILLTMGYNDAKNHADYSDLMYATVNGDRVTVFSNEDGNYLFLPSYAGEYKLSGAASQIDINVMQSEGIAAIFINTIHSTIDDLYSDRNNELRGRIKVIAADGEIDYEAAIKSISGRGNTSWNSWEKKPFTITCKEDVSILGMNKGCRYALLPNAADATLIRNELAQSISCELAKSKADSEQPYVCRGEFADIYINGEYLGNYYICPTVDVGTDRVNITDLEAEMDRIYAKVNMDALENYDGDETKAKKLHSIPDDYTGGYLIEGEYMERYEHEMTTRAADSGFITNHDRCFLIKSPKTISHTQVEYLRAFINDMESALEAEDFINPKTHLGLENYLDIESMATRYLVEEITANYDGAVSSEYYYKDSEQKDNRLHAGPGWDYDMSMGNYVEWMSYGVSEDIGITKLRNDSTDAWWYVRLYEYEPYLDIVKNMYAEVARPYLKKIVSDRIDEYQSMLAKSAMMDSIRWKDMYNGLGHHAGETESYEELKDFLNRRMQTLDDEWM